MQSHTEPFRAIVSHRKPYRAKCELSAAKTAYGFLYNAFHCLAIFNILYTVILYILEIFDIATLAPEESPILTQRDQRMGRRVASLSLNQPASQPPDHPHKIGLSH